MVLHLNMGLLIVRFDQILTDIRSLDELEFMCCMIEGNPIVLYVLVVVFHKLGVANFCLQSFLFKEIERNVSNETYGMLHPRIDGSQT